jgi:cytoskeletal protein RodZ
MKKLNMLAVAGTLALTLGLTGCGSDSSSDSSAQSPSQSSSAAASSASTSSDSASSSQSQETSSSSSSSSAAAPGGITTCQLDRKGQQVDATVVGLSCDDATAIWNKFSGKDTDMATADVEHNGETFKCAVMAQGATTTGGCTVGAKAISIGGV